MADTFWDDAKALGDEAVPPSPQPSSIQTQSDNGDSFWRDAEAMTPPAKAAKPPVDTGGPWSRTFTDVPSEIKGAFMDSVNTINNTLNPFSQAYQSRMLEESKAPIGQRLAMSGSDILGTPGNVMAIPGMASAPLTGTTRSVLGHPFAKLGGISYDQAKQDVDTSMLGLSAGNWRYWGSATPAPLSPVTFTKGQAARDPSQIRLENQARSGDLGGASQEIAKRFDTQQGQQIADEQSRISGQLSPNPATPQEAGEIVSRGIQQRAADAKSATSQAYEKARNSPGELDSSLFPNMGSNIRTQLFNSTNPVIIDDKMTPGASRAVDYLDGAVDDLYKSGFKPTVSGGIPLTGVDQIRKKLSAFRTQASLSGNPSDGRAAQAVIDAFDNNINAGVNSAAFTGNPLAVQAWNDARASHADYRSTFTESGRKDSIGRILDQITGRNNQNTLTPNAVIDHLIGSSGVNPTSVQVGVANRVKQIFGANSPEWGAVKSGLFSRLVDTGEGVTDFGHGTIANRVNRFLSSDGKEMADTVYSPDEQAMIKSYADLHRQLEPPKTGAVNYSGTSPFVNPTLKRILGTVVGGLGAVASQYLLPDVITQAGGLAHGAMDLGALLMGYEGTKRGVDAMQNLKNARMITKQMPIFGQLLKQWQTATNRATQANTPANHKALAIATTNLAGALQRHGINLGDIWNKELGMTQ